jgi:DNA invertase Pin-like site-specific DNA recombinase
MKTAYSYVRLSQKRQISGTGAQRQSKLEMICKANGWTPADKTFSDWAVVLTL